MYIARDKTVTNTKRTCMTCFIHTFLPVEGILKKKRGREPLAQPRKNVQCHRNSQAPEGGRSTKHADGSIKSQEQPSEKAPEMKLFTTLPYVLFLRRHESFLSSRLIPLPPRHLFTDTKLHVERENQSSDFVWKQTRNIMNECVTNTNADGR